MAHIEQMRFFSLVFDSLDGIGNDLRVIDIGSLDINGGPHSLIKQSGIEYLGVDIGDGPNVDIIARAELLDIPTGSFNLAMSSECWEHNPFWVEAHFQMCRITEPGGLVIWSCAGIGRAEHGTVNSDNLSASPLLQGVYATYYSNVSAGRANKVLNLDWWFDDYLLFNHLSARDTYFVGLRKGTSAHLIEDFAKLKSKIEFEFRNYPLWMRIRNILDLNFHSLLPIYVWLEVRFIKIIKGLVRI